MPEFISKMAALANQNIVVAVALAAVLALLIWRRPKLFGGLLLLILILAAVWYFIMDLGDIGTRQKKKMYDQTDRQVEQSR